MPWYDVAHRVTVTKTNMIDEMPCGYGTLQNHWCENMAPSPLQSLCRGLSSSRSLPQTCTEVSTAPQCDYSNSQTRTILNAPPSLEVVSGAHENAVAQSESTSPSSRGGWDHLEVFNSTVDRSAVSGGLAYGFRTELCFADVLCPMIYASKVHLFTVWFPLSQKTQGKCHSDMIR